MEQYQTVKDRILIYIVEKGLSQGKFEKQAGLSNGYVNNLKKAPSAAVLQKMLSAFPDINSVWLLSGEGDMIIGPQIDDHHNIHAGSGNHIEGGIHQDNRQYYSDSPDVLRAQVEKMEMIIQAKSEHIATLDEQIAKKDEQIAKKDEQIAKKDEQIAGLIDALRVK